MHSTVYALGCLQYFHIYFTSFHSSWEIWTQQIGLAPNVWLHNSVGRASYRYRGGHGFESRWNLDFFRRLLSNCLNWKIYCDDHSSLWSTTTVQIYDLFHIYFTSVFSILHFNASTPRAPKPCPFWTRCPEPSGSVRLAEKVKSRIETRHLNALYLRCKRV